jgi:hypothetical protein
VSAALRIAYDLKGDEWGRHLLGHLAVERHAVEERDVMQREHANAMVRRCWRRGGVSGHSVCVCASSTARSCQMEYGLC